MVKLGFLIIGIIAISLFIFNTIKHGLKTAQSSAKSDGVTFPAFFFDNFYIWWNFTRYNLEGNILST